MAKITFDVEPSDLLHKMYDYKLMSRAWGKSARAWRKHSKLLEATFRALHDAHPELRDELYLLRPDLFRGKHNG